MAKRDSGPPLSITGQGVSKKVTRNIDLTAGPCDGKAKGVKGLVLTALVGLWQNMGDWFDTQVGSVQGVHIIADPPTCLF